MWLSPKGNHMDHEFVGAFNTLRLLLKRFDICREDDSMTNDEMGKRKVEGNDSGLGDGGIVRRKAKERKTSSAKTVAKPGQNGDGEAQYHKIVATIGPIRQHSESGDCSSSINRDDGTNLCIGCDLRDSWTHKYRPEKNKRRRAISEDLPADIISHLEYYGYSFQQDIAKGRFGSVMLASSREHRKPVALKLLNGSTVRRKASGSPGSDDSPTETPAPWNVEIPEEILLHSKLKHRNIVDFMSYMYINEQFCVVMEFCEDESLDKLLKMRPAGFLSESNARRYFQNMIDAVEYLHHQCVVHRDVKCANFLIDHENKLKLCDFGYARKYVGGDALFRDYAGTPGHEAPEILEHRPYNPRFTDIWSLGVTLFNMLTGKLPFGQNGHHENLSRIRKGPSFPHKSVLRLTVEVRELLQGIMCYVPEYRYTLNRIKYCPWILQNDDKVSIGFYHLVRQPQKKKDSVRERDLKSYYGI